MNRGSDRRSRSTAPGAPAASRRIRRLEIKNLREPARTRRMVIGRRERAYAVKTGTGGRRHERRSLPSQPLRPPGPAAAIRASPASSMTVMDPAAVSITASALSAFSSRETTSRTVPTVAAKCC